MYNLTIDFYTAVKMGELESHESPSINLKKISRVVSTLPNYMYNIMSECLNTKYFSTYEYKYACNAKAKSG